MPGEADHQHPHPLYCVWEITLRCDLACLHCGSRAGQARPEELSTAECLDVVAQLARLGVREVTLIGGEAYLREDWDIIAAAIVDAGMDCGLTTGARALTAERLRRAVAAGVCAISISLDGLEEAHDAQRQVRGSWDAAVKAAAAVAASPIQLSVNTQVNRRSLGELLRLSRKVVALGARAWQVQLTVAMGRAADRPELLLQPADLLELFPLLVWIKQRHLDPAGVLLLPGNNVGYFGPYERLLRPGGEHGAHWQGCAAGRWTLGLEADGTLKGCPSLPTADYAGGNIRTMPIEAIVRAAAAIQDIQHRTAADLWGYCRRCYYAEPCLGGCTWTAHALLGRPGNNPMCIHRVTTLMASGRRERLVPAQPAPGRPFDHGRFELVEEEFWPR